MHEGLYQQYLIKKGINTTFEQFKQKKLHVFDKFFRKIVASGLYCNDYQSLRNSPRGNPVDYGMKLNNVCGTLTDYFLGEASSIYKEYDMIILDVDRVSWYTTVLIGLYPDRLPHIKHAVQTKGSGNLVG